MRPLQPFYTKDFADEMTVGVHEQTLVASLNGKPGYLVRLELLWMAGFLQSARRLGKSCAFPPGTCSQLTPLARPGADFKMLKRLPKRTCCDMFA